MPDTSCKLLHICNVLREARIAVYIAMNTAVTSVLSANARFTKPISLFLDKKSQSPFVPRSNSRAIRLNNATRQICYVIKMAVSCKSRNTGVV